MEDVLERDELWSFVRSKAQIRWLWVALCRRTRQVVAYVLGDHSERTCRGLWERIPEDYRLALCYTDFWESYQKVVPEEQHVPVEKGSGETNRVERWNNTLRQRLGRFVHKTLSNSQVRFHARDLPPAFPPRVQPDPRLIQANNLRCATTRRAFICSIEVIGEASKKISEEFPTRYPQIQWRVMAGMRDHLIHT